MVPGKVSVFRQLGFSLYVLKADTKATVTVRQTMTLSPFNLLSFLEELATAL